VCDELRTPVARPHIVEFGCGTGWLTVPALANRPDATYHAFDDSEARVAVVANKLSWRGHVRDVTFTAPLDLRSRAIGEALRGLRADFLLLPRFLQTVPLVATEGAKLHRTSFLALCQQLVRPGGRICIIEDVYGENADEEATLSQSMRDGFRARLVADLERVVHVLRGLDPTLAGRVARLPGDPSLLGDLRDRVQPPGAAQPLPLSAWQRMFEHLGFKYQTLQHPAQKQLFLFTVRC
jgi:hypothetical protein